MILEKKTLMLEALSREILANQSVKSRKIEHMYQNRHSKVNTYLKA